MIFGKRIRIEGRITLESDMHIGGSDVHVDEDAIIRDHCGTPIIPASSLKGVLRAAVEEACPDEAAEIFGEPSQHGQGTGRAAQLWLDHAVMGDRATGLEGLSKDLPDKGVFRSRHVSICPATGAAAPNRLFDREMVAAGASFSFVANWFGGKLIDLLPVFALLRDGCRIGSGTTKGQGRIVLAPASLAFLSIAPDENGRLVEVPLDRDEVNAFLDSLERTHLPDKVAPRRVRLMLSAEGPFLSVRTCEGNEMQPLERCGKPVLWPSSVAGALRARARWLEACRVDAETAVDDPNRRRSKAERRNELTSVERVFGVTGRKGLLGIESVTCRDPGRQIRLTSNSIDRFTGATRYTALHGKRAYWKPTFEVQLEIGEDHPLLERLLEDLDGGMLELGHGSSIGFGWFNIEVEKADDGT